MTDESKTTDGTTSASGTQATGEKKSNGGEVPAGVQARIDALVAERERYKTQATELSTKYTELENKHKTDTEKQVDMIVAERIKPYQERNTALEAFVKSDLETALAQIPEAHRGGITDTQAPLEVQLRQVRTILSARSEVAKQPAIRSGAQPANGNGSEKRQVPKAEYAEWLASASTNPALYYGKRTEMLAARQEGRVEGYSNSAGF